MKPFPARRDLTILAAHAAYRMAECLARRAPDLRVVEARSREAAAARLAEADVLLVSGFWRDDWLAQAPRLRFIQSISAGVDQYGKDALRARHVRLASAHGVNARAVAEHAMALILSLSRRLHLARDLQAARRWTGMASDPAQREDELGGKTLLILGYGAIGGHLAHLARAFGVKVIAVKRDLATNRGLADEIVGPEALADHLPRADLVALCCPLTDETRGLIDARALAAMKPGAALINVARGAVVDEPAMIAALQSGRLAAAALDCFVEEPLPAASPLWAMPQVIVTHHVGGETRAYEDNVVDILLDNLARLERGDPQLRNQVV
ncbi:MAG: D-2-hydroxyacid dehydrogenase [Methylobacteriaceae bacterium]|nr:D-2-hydroxyacid dehydrogenase [Methylobacteriaceae bacterium]